MNGLVGIVTLVLAVGGVVLNNRRLRVCFVLWMISNILSACLHIKAAMWPLAVRDVIFFVFAVEGWFLWKKKCREQSAIEAVKAWPPCPINDCPEWLKGAAADCSSCPKDKGRKQAEE